MASRFAFGSGVCWVRLLSGFLLSSAVVATLGCGSRNTIACTDTALVASQLSTRGAPNDWSARHLLGASTMATNAVAQHERRLLYAVLQTAQQSCFGDTNPSVSSTSTVDWEHNLGASMADGTFPAKYNFNLPGQTPTCSDFVIYGLNTPGSSTQANLIGFANLYSGTAGSSGNGLCNDKPGVYQLYYPSYTYSYAATLKFAYNGSTINGSITNSITLSEDGQKFAYVESTGTASAFHVVGVPSGDNNSSCYGPTQTSCGAVATVPPSIKTVPSSGSWSAADSFSSVWVDYANDVAYVGTDDGVLHKIQNVFCSTATCKASPVNPSEVTKGGWPVTLTGAGPLTSPVQAPSGVIYAAGATSGKLYAVSSAGAVTVSTQSFMPNSIKDGPLLDVDGTGTTQALYWFSNSKSAQSNPSVRQPQLVQTNSALTTFNNYSLLLNGTDSWPAGGDPNVNIHAGTFDNAFFNTRTGNIWACGWWQNGQYAGNHQGIVRFGINGTTVTPDTSKIYAQTSPDWVPSTLNTCAPIAEAVGSNGADRIFVSSRTGYTMGNCSSQASCMAAFAVTSSGSPAVYSLQSTASFNLSTVGSSQMTSEYTDYASGAIIDNWVDPNSNTCGPNKNQSCSQAASIYFSYGKNAVKLTQAELK